jgi:hypothetical protein
VQLRRLLRQQMPQNGLRGRAAADVAEAYKENLNRSFIINDLNQTFKVII